MNLSQISFDLFTPQISQLEKDHYNETLFCNIT